MSANESEPTSIQLWPQVGKNVFSVSNYRDGILVSASDSDQPELKIQLDRIEAKLDELLSRSSSDAVQGDVG